MLVFRLTPVDQISTYFHFGAGLFAHTMVLEYKLVTQISGGKFLPRSRKSEIILKNDFLYIRVTESMFQSYKATGEQISAPTLKSRDFPLQEL